MSDRRPGADYISSLIDASYERISSHLVRTPLVFDNNRNLWLKCENQQTTGSFKLRGALSKLSSLPPGSQVVTASTGNHGAGVAKASLLFDQKVKVFIPSTTTAQKKEKLIKLGVDLVQAWLVN